MIAVLFVFESDGSRLARDAGWKGIPIMPGAITGEGDEEGYVFTIQATPQQVQDYYQRELENWDGSPWSNATATHP